jgi:hypothetical protein
MINNRFNVVYLMLAVVRNINDKIKQNDKKRRLLKSKGNR